ncbi:hypothetical protein D3C80_1443340 [compost metagenome]
MPVNRVVGSHNRIGASLPYCDFKAFQVDLPKGSLRHDRIHLAAMLLLVIAGEMLQRSVRAASHHPPCTRSGKSSRNQRVLREVLEVAPIKRTASNIETRSQQGVYVVSQQLLAFQNIQFFDQIHIPGCGKQGPNGNLGRLLPGVHPNSGWSIRRTTYRNAVTQQTVAYAPEGGSRTWCDQRTAHAFSSNDGSQVLIAKLGDKGFHSDCPVMHIS